MRGLSEGTLERIEKLEQLRALEHGYAIRVVISQYDSPDDVDKIEGITARDYALHGERAAPIGYYLD